MLHLAREEKIFIDQIEIEEEESFQLSAYQLDFQNIFEFTETKFIKKEKDFMKTTQTQIKGIKKHIS